MVKSAYQQARQTWLCNGCAFPKPDTEVVDATIQEEKPDNTPLNMISGCGVGIARKDFLFAFGEELARQHLYLGQVFDPSGSPMEDWITFVGHHKIIIRGSKNVTVRCCSECGRNVYFGMGQFHLYPQPSYGVSIFDAGNGILVISKDLVRRINLNKWRKLDYMELPVLETPKDGLAELKEM
jgi:hypothetical protein